MAPPKKATNATKPKATASTRQAPRPETRMSEEVAEVSSADDMILPKNTANKNGKRPQISQPSEAESKGKGRAKKPKNRQLSSTPAEADEVIVTEGARGTGVGVQRDGTLQPHPTAIGLSQRVSRLLSREPSAGLSAYQQAYPPNSDLRLTNDDEAVAMRDKQIALLEEKLKKLQTELTQLRDTGAAKDQLFEEYRQLRETEPERQLLRLKTETQAALTTKESIITSQAKEVVKGQRTVTELYEKLARISSGEEDRIRERLEQDKQDLLQRNEELRANVDIQRRRRKDTERLLKHAQADAEEAVQERLKELEKEAIHNQKMWEQETKHSIDLNTQLNQLRVLTGQPGRNGGAGSTNPASDVLARVATGGTEAMEDMKARLTVLGNFTGFQIRGSSKSNKGNIYDCLFTSCTNAKYALHFRLSHHHDHSYSYDPSLDPSRDCETIQILPDYLKDYLHFEKDCEGKFFLQLLTVFNGLK